MNCNGHRSDVVVMVFTGEYDLTCREQLRGTLDSLFEASSVVLDLSAATYIDSTVINELVRLHNARSARGLDRVACVVQNGNLLRLFDILRLGDIFHVVETLDEAVYKNGEDVSVQYASSFAGS